MIRRIAATALTGRVTAFEFSDGIARPCAGCSGDCCCCCEVENMTTPEGTYITVRLDGSPRIHFGRVVVQYQGVES